MEEDHTQGRRRKTTAEGRLQQREDYSRREATARGHIHPLQWVPVDAVEAVDVVEAVDAVETSVNHYLRTWSSLGIARDFY